MHVKPDFAYYFSNIQQYTVYRIPYTNRNNIATPKAKPPEAKNTRKHRQKQ
jgi:hypothetical protein